MQSKRGSFAESVIGTGVGFMISLVAQLIVFPLYGINIKLSENLQILIIFTLISIARQYVLRRVFNNITIKRMLANDKVYQSR